jgi:zinc transport system substrate-binding protein
MRNRVLIALFLLQTMLNAVNVVVSIPPEWSFVKEIAQNRANVAVMVAPGFSPHTYEPRPLQMVKIAKADIYFSIGVEFEKVWLKKFEKLNKKLMVVDLSNGIEKIYFSPTSPDPHVWLAPGNIKIIAKNIYETLIKKEPKESEFYKKNYDEFVKKIDKTDKKIREILKDTPKGAKFMVFHPSWGYFAKRYNLKQLAIEVEGKKPKPKQLINIIKEAKEEQVKAIFVQPEFSDEVARTIANSLDIEIIKTSPLAKEWAENLKNLAKAIAKGDR